jgi:hypothetical protein
MQAAPSMTGCDEIGLIVGLSPRVKASQYSEGL